LFHAYPDANESVTDNHIELITRLINMGIDPSVINIEGQNAEEAYMESRLEYLDEYYNAQVEKINQERKVVAYLAQNNMDDAMEIAMDEIAKKKVNQSKSRARTRARRIEALNKIDDSLSRVGMPTETSSFVRDTSDVETEIEYDELEKDTTNQIRAKYKKELNDANDEAERKKKELELSIKTLKTDEIENSKARQILVTSILTGS
jgi:hypothetical protein